ncbi:acyl carrier protein [Streptomyces sp. NRRL S-37]|uniref:acyl carrier protein n=1 Tax=Streptomyces sp. NRRL S-37 TaxID=1463903 RepID=UPI0004CC875A|nr:phosphopantetheine-binding protein [Streptomyces sp. NRRL S-37]
MAEETRTALDKERLRGLLAEILDVDVSQISDRARFVDDLGVDSLMALEITVRLEAEFPVKLAEEELTRLATLDDTYALLDAKLRAAS